MEDVRTFFFEQAAEGADLPERAEALPVDGQSDVTAALGLQARDEASAIRHDERFVAPVDEEPTHLEAAALDAAPVEFG